MNELLDGIEFFHFLRPGWLTLIPAVLALWWWVRRSAKRAQSLPEGLAPHLAAALTVGGEHRFRFLAVDGIATMLVLTAMATAGPTWSRVVSPFVSQTAPLAVALSMAESMLTPDVAPDRLERSKQKLLDLLGERVGGRTALIAYAGTAHRVVPLTEDPAVMKPFIEGLSPAVMPEPGRNASAALALAQAALMDESVPGAILFILDEFDSADLPAFVEHASSGGVGVVFLCVGSSEDTMARLDRVPGGATVSLTADASDVRRVERRVASAYRAALAKDDEQEWEDRGWMLAWPASLLVLVYFRRGWTILIGLLITLGGMAGAPEAAHAEGVVETVEEWFFTPDQRGRLAFEDGRYQEAAEFFEDPLWKGYALYVIGDYEEAASTLARLDSGESAFIQGMALVKGRQYRPAIRAFEVALERDPAHPSAAHNLEVTRTILEYLEQMREATDTGEGSEGADEIVFDAESDRGAMQVMTARDQNKIESAEQWMRTVETRTEDFLSIRFALEAVGEGS